MPLSNNSGLDGIGFSRAAGYVVQYPQCHKRKLCFNNEDNDCGMDGESPDQPWMDCTSEPKRQCLWPSDGRLSLNSSRLQEGQQHNTGSLQMGHLTSQSDLNHFSSLSSSSPSSSLPLQVTPEVAASVSFSSAAMMTSSLVTSSSPSPLRSSSPYPQHQHRRHEEALKLAGPANNNNSLAQDLSEVEEMRMEGENLKELNNNNNNNNNLIKNSTFSDNGHTDFDEAMDAHISMDSDCVPNMAQYGSATSSTPQTMAALSSSSPSPLCSSSSSSSSSSSQFISAPQNIYGTEDRRCGFLACSGLKPSPVTGRLHCLCSASWRGMYGMDAAYMTDYY
ncbi:hypothetical protein PoB_002454200 [Plakobranchus ocellatus]|uniref:Uncharacterized protein n=1 Tax=Plakobranchus ocellatus TaxID=259542 RepID=A0AAV3ZTN8_9GAST|nr:hypothetical protein PoB_002454200 [Plakobranchus ocellatus]